MQIYTIVKRGFQQACTIIAETILSKALRREKNIILEYPSLYQTCMYLQKKRTLIELDLRDCRMGYTLHQWRSCATFWTSEERKKSSTQHYKPCDWHISPLFVVVAKLTHSTYVTHTSDFVVSQRCVGRIDNNHKLHLRVCHVAISVSVVKINMLCIRKQTILKG